MEVAGVGGAGSSNPPDSYEILSALGGDARSIYKPLNVNESTGLPHHTQHRYGYTRGHYLRVGIDFYIG